MAWSSVEAVLQINYKENRNRLKNKQKTNKQINPIGLFLFYLDYINTINEEKRLLELNEILKSDLSRVIRIMKENEKGFKHFMNYFKNENGLNKSDSFLSTVKSFYKPQFTFSHDTNAIIKVMIKYGYEFKSRKEIVDLIYK